MRIRKLERPLAITMWDFSWLERRWPGAGYEDWDQALDELLERGYDAVRIDAYPHLVARDAEGEHTLLPCWNQQTWGSPARNRVTVLPELLTFIRKCADRGIAVGLSTWFQRDEAHSLDLIKTPEDHARIWSKVLQAVLDAGLLEHILYVDFCNEWPQDVWAPFFKGDESEGAERQFVSPDSLGWISRTLDEARRLFDDVPLTFSNVGALNPRENHLGTLRKLDFLEPHIWMALANGWEYYKTLNYNFERFDPSGFERLVANSRKLYEDRKDHWKKVQCDLIDAVCDDAHATGLPLITTECWGVVDYKDWPLLEWDWVKETTEHGLRHAASKGLWLAMATSNFCGPQFVGMWRDIDWHRRMTDLIKSSDLPEDYRK